MQGVSIIKHLHGMITYTLELSVIGFVWSSVVVFLSINSRDIGWEERLQNTYFVIVE